MISALCESDKKFFKSFNFEGVPQNVKDKFEELAEILVSKTFKKDKEGDRAIKRSQSNLPPYEYSLEEMIKFYKKINTGMLHQYEYDIFVNDKLDAFCKVYGKQEPVMKDFITRFVEFKDKALTLLNRQTSKDYITLLKFTFYRALKAFYWLSPIAHKDKNFVIIPEFMFDLMECYGTIKTIFLKNDRFYDIKKIERNIKLFTQIESKAPDESIDAYLKRLKKNEVNKDVITKKELQAWEVLFKHYEDTVNYYSDPDALSEELWEEYGRQEAIEKFSFHCGYGNFDIDLDEVECEKEFFLEHHKERFKQANDNAKNLHSDRDKYDENYGMDLDTTLLFHWEVVPSGVSISDIYNLYKENREVFLCNFLSFNHFYISQLRIFITLFKERTNKELFEFFA